MAEPLEPFRRLRPPRTSIDPAGSFKLASGLFEVCLKEESRVQSL
jgi:hypothetical protein